MCLPQMGCFTATGTLTASFGGASTAPGKSTKPGCAYVRGLTVLGRIGSRIVCRADDCPCLLWQYRATAVGSPTDRLLTSRCESADRTRGHPPAIPAEAVMSAIVRVVSMASILLTRQHSLIDLARTPRRPAGCAPGTERRREVGFGDPCATAGPRCRPRADLHAPRASVARG